MDHPKFDDAVFTASSELFSLLSTPIRLKILCAVCDGERNVSELLQEIETTQPNMSQHLSALFKSGVLVKRREGNQIFYRLHSNRVATLCRAVCSQVAEEFEDDKRFAPNDRLIPMKLQGG